MSGRKFQLPKKQDPVSTPRRNDSVQEKERDYSPGTPTTRSDAERPRDRSSPSPSVTGRKQGVDTADHNPRPDSESPKSPGSEWSEVDPEDTPARAQGTPERSRHEPTKSSNLEDGGLPRPISAKDVDPQVTGPAAADDGVVKSPDPFRRKNPESTKSSKPEGEELPRPISAKDVDPQATGPTAADDGVVKSPDRFRGKNPEPTKSSKPEGGELPRSISAKDVDPQTAGRSATVDPTTPSDVTGRLDRVRSPTRHGTSSENVRDPIKSDTSHGNVQPTTPVITRRPDIAKSNAGQAAANGEIPPEDHKEWKSPSELEYNGVKLKITKCVQIQFGNWEGHVQINQIHETLPAERSWFTCQFLYAGKDLPGGDSLLSNERAISRRDTIVPITAVRAASDARRLKRGEVAEECKTIFWRSGFDPENPSAGIRMSRDLTGICACGDPKKEEKLVTCGNCKLKQHLGCVKENESRKVEIRTLTWREDLGIWAAYPQCIECRKDLTL